MEGGHITSFGFKGSHCNCRILIFGIILGLEGRTERKRKKVRFEGVSTWLRKLLSRWERSPTRLGSLTREVWRDGNRARAIHCHSHWSSRFGDNTYCRLSEEKAGINKTSSGRCCPASCK